MTENTQVKVKRFVTASKDGLVDKEYATKRSAQERVRKIGADRLRCFDRNNLPEGIELRFKPVHNSVAEIDAIIAAESAELDSADFLPENPESRAAAKAEAKAFNEAYDAGKILEKAEKIAEGTIKAFKREKVGLAAMERNLERKRKAVANPAKKTKGNKADKKQKAPAKPRATWTIAVMTEDGKEVEENVVTGGVPKEYGGCVKMGEYAQEIANKRGRIVKHINEANGKEWKKKPVA